MSEEFRGKSFATFSFDAKFGEPEAEMIEFGHYKGRNKWPTLMHIPDQRIRDALLNLDRLSGRHRICLGGTAEGAAAECAQRL